MKNPSTKKITVLTATLNAENFISKLINSIQSQTDKDFEWLIIDGKSTDRTLSLIEEVKDIPVRFLSTKDFGIYDALNRGIQLIGCGYYIVVGADDALDSDAIQNYRSALDEGDADIVTAAIRQNGRVIAPREGLGWLYGLPGIASSHSVGMMIKIDLHERFGLYSHKLPIAADQLFIKKALYGGAKILRKPFVAGEFSVEGTSGSDPVGLLTEVFRVQLLTERIVIIQYLLFGLRLLKLYIWSILRITPFRFASGRYLKRKI